MFVERMPSILALGFLSENASFAEMVEEHGMTFIGPTPDHIRYDGG
jgi:acetyl-CoA carboxylase biotin carboxylase subunit